MTHEHVLTLLFFTVVLKPVTVYCRMSPYLETVHRRQLLDILCGSMLSTRYPFPRAGLVSCRHPATPASFQFF